MVKRKGGTRRKTRYKLNKHARRKGKISFTSFFEIYNVGDKVLLRIEPSYHHGMFHPRFHMKPAVVKGKRGFCYVVDLNDRGKHKDLIVHPVHLKRIEVVEK